MQAKIKCKISNARSVCFPEKAIELKLDSVEGNTISENGNKLKCSFEGTLTLKEVVGNQLKIGSILVLDVNIE